tara:strand:- start:780 stop:1547 length:768 start_codon:yes stop_codon:yes gene_type:complete
VDQLNQAFLAGVADDDLTKAGVFMRAFDQLEDGDRPWLPCQLEKCMGVSDRFASSIVNRRHPDLYTSGVGGIVISWEGVSINCAYYADGGSQKQTCSPPGRSKSCMPGCTRGWCDPNSWRNWGCAWSGNHLGHMLKQQDTNRGRGGYNEVVIDGEQLWLEHVCTAMHVPFAECPAPFAPAAATWSAHMPNTVLAIFTLPESNPGYRARAVEVHNRFLSENGRTADQVPLLLYDKGRCPCYDQTSGCDCQGPFSVL